MVKRVNEQNPTRWQIYTTADPTVERIIPKLAKEIGLNESIILMQISYWIGISENVRDGTYWTYHSVRELHEDYFPYWSVTTIWRAIKSLEDQGYIIVREYNQRKGDNTQWFALEPDKLQTLTSVLAQPALGEKPVSKRNTLFQNETPLFQNETTLPETTTETTPENYLASDDALQPAILSNPPISVKVPASQMNPVKDAIALAFAWDWTRMTGAEKGLVQKAARELCLAGVTASEVPSLYKYCAGKFTQFKPLALASNVSEWRKGKAGHLSGAEMLKKIGATEEVT